MRHKGALVLIVQLGFLLGLVWVWKWQQAVLPRIWLRVQTEPGESPIKGYTYRALEIPDPVAEWNPPFQDAVYGCISKPDAIPQFREGRWLLVPKYNIPGREAPHTIPVEWLSADWIEGPDPEAKHLFLLQRPQVFIPRNCPSPDQIIGMDLMLEFSISRGGVLKPIRFGLRSCMAGASVVPVEFGF